MPVNISRPQINIREKLSELERPIGITGQSLMSSNTGEEANIIVGAHRKNLIINGDFQVDQRNVGSVQTVAANTNVYTLDRWNLNQQTGGQVSVQQSGGDTPIGIKNSVRLRCTSTNTLSAGSYVLLTTVLEQRDLKVLRYGTSSASYSVVSFYAKSTIPGHCITFEYYASNGQQISKSFVLSTTWQRYYAIIPPNFSTTYSDNHLSGGYFNFWVASGTTYTSGTFNNKNWQSSVNGNRVDPRTGANFMTAVNNDVWIAGVQWEVGATLTPFEYRTYADELRLCQRYYEKSFEDSTIPALGANATSFSTEVALNWGWAGHRSGYPTNNYPGRCTFAKFKVAKRVTPAVSLYGNSGGYPYIYDTTNGGRWVNTSWGVYNSKEGFEMGNEFTSVFQNWAFCHWTASAEF